jgi:PBP1b-binding outer membrane lipoprotein LpoB
VYKQTRQGRIQARVATAADEISAQEQEQEQQQQQEEEQQQQQHTFVETQRM